MNSTMINQVKKMYKEDISRTKAYRYSDVTLDCRQINDLIWTIFVSEQRVKFPG